MDLFSIYELHDQFTLHDVSYLLDGHEPLSPDLPPKNDPHERIRHRADMLGRQLISDARTGKLCATRRDNESWRLAEAAEWTVKRNDLKDWAKGKMIRPPFLFLPLPLLDTVQNVATAKVKVGTESHAFEMEYGRALLHIAKQINNAQLVAYLLDSGGEFDKLKGDNAVMLQMRAFLVQGIKSKEHLKNLLTGEKTSAGNLVSNMEWTERIHIPVVTSMTETRPQSPEWEKHRTPELEAMKKVIAEYWLNHDPNRPPKKETIVAHLKKLGVSQGVAESLDTAMRPVEARKGGNRRFPGKNPNN